MESGRGMNILLLNGPNLNLLGEREPEIYGKTTLPELEVDELHQSRRWAQGVIFNPGAFTHYSYALRDAIAACKLRVVEVHLSDISKREPWRRVSVLEEVCAHRVLGKGVAGYLEALEWLLK